MSVPSPAIAPTTTGLPGAADGTTLRVLHVVTLFSDRGAFGGPTSVALGLARELGARGHRVTVAGLRDCARVTDVPGVTLRLAPARTLVPGAGVLGRFHPRLAAVLWHEVGRSDVVHVHAGRDLVSLAALAIARLRRRPYVVQTHGMVMPRTSAAARAFDLALRPLLRAGRVRLVLTDVEASGLARLLPGAVTTRLGNGVRRGPDVPAPGGVPRVVFLARLHPRKRVLAFAELARELARRGVVAECVAFGPDAGELAPLRQAIADGAPVTYGGGVAHDEAQRVLAGAAVYVLPSVDEPFPMTVLEALAGGTPCVVTDSCGLVPQLLGSAGARVCDGSATAMADAVQDLLAAGPRARRAARETVATRFDEGVVVDRLIELYRGALPRPGARAAS